jgi:endonuclease/exonuclease/phosphatase (EEP) superfamily protein YafD
MPLTRFTLLLLAALFAPAAATDNKACLDALFESAQPASGPALNGQSISVLNWNIQKSSQPGWLEDLQRLAVGSDLVLLQEATLEAELRDKLDSNYHAVFAPGYNSDEYRSGVLTVSSVAPDAHCTLSHDEPWLGTPKATNISRYPISGQSEQLLVINLHGVNFSLNSTALAQQLNDSSNLVSQHQGPVIFSGDFNTWSDIRMNMLQGFMESLGLQALDFPIDQRTQMFGNVLDHIYVRGLQVISAGTTEVDSSDHNPVHATLSVGS